jgi:hypothetical protein
MAVILVGIVIVEIAKQSALALPKNLRRTDSYYQYSEMQDYQLQFDACFISSKNTRRINEFYIQECLRPYTNSRPKYLLLGDSHAAHLRKAMAEQLAPIAVVGALASGCRPILNTPGQVGCQELMNYEFNVDIPHSHYECIVVSARWSKIDPPLIATTVEYLRRYAPRVVILGPSPEYTGVFPSILVRIKTARLKLELSEFTKKDLAVLDERLREAALSAGADYISLYSLMHHLGSKNEIPANTPDGVPVYFDADHFTLQGARLVMEKIAPQLLKHLKQLK